LIKNLSVDTASFIIKSMPVLERICAKVYWAQVILELEGQ
jgi:hypothetical protein